MNRGSRHPRLRAARPRRRFNEAPIHESGKCAAREHPERGHGHASMRPRFMNRGSLIDPASVGTSPDGLQ